MGPGTQRGRVVVPGAFVQKDWLPTVILRARASARHSGGRLPTWALPARSRTALEAVALRQQLALIKRKQPRPKVDRLDRLFWIVLRRLWEGWSEVLIIVKPETADSWHRAGFRVFWRWRSQPRRAGRPKDSVVPHRAMWSSLIRMASARREFRTGSGAKIGDNQLRAIRWKARKQVVDRMTVTYF
jgi:hypothetical protein